MAKKEILEGWVEVDRPPRAQKSYGADATSAPPRPRPASRGADAARARPALKKSKLRGVFLRPASGSDAETKLVLVDRQNRPKIAQG